MFDLGEEAVAVRRDDDTVEVRRGPGRSGGATDDPDQFRWRGRVSTVRSVLAHEIELSDPPARERWRLVGARG